jgi:hypothetical protein
MARPLFVMLTSIGSLSGRLRLYRHLTSPDLTSKATTSEGGSTVKMTPPTTIGVDSLLDPLDSLVPNWRIHRTRSRETFSGVISVNGV